MLNLFLIIPTKTKLLLLALLIGIVLITIFLALLDPAQESIIPTQQNLVFPLQRTIPGQKISQEAEKRLDITKKETSDEGKSIYSLQSQNPIRTDQIITQNNQVIFERIYVPENPNDPNHLLISSMLEKYGQPEKTVQGSKLWGPFIMLYVYSSKGLAFIGNPNTNEVYELQTFTPLSAEEYIQRYGDDIDESPPQGES